MPPNSPQVRDPSYRNRLAPTQACGRPVRAMRQVQIGTFRRGRNRVDFTGNGS